MKHFDLSKEHAQVRTLLKEGGVIAYPTEAVYGLGCDPFAQTAVMNILKMKKRAVNKGLILIAADFEDIVPLVDLDQVPKDHLEQARASWPGPYTWIFPASDRVPAWIRGDYKSVAVRITAHPIARQLCQLWGGPLVSTSANEEGCPPATTQDALVKSFKYTPDALILGQVGEALKPTQIRDVKTLKVIRAST